MVDQNADLKIENLTQTASDAVFASPCEPLIPMECFTPLRALDRSVSFTEVSLDQVFQCGMGWPFGRTDLGYPEAFFVSKFPTMNAIPFDCIVKLVDLVEVVPELRRRSRHRKINASPR